MRSPVVLLGLGFSTSRLARRLRLRDLPVIGVVRNPWRFADLARVGVRIAEFGSREIPPGAVAVHTIPPLPLDENANLRRSIMGIEPRRVVYISSTSVYGAQSFVDSHTVPAPCEEKGRRRMEEESWLRSQAWSSLTVRPAAIYGPGRGVHVRVREGKPPRVAGGIVVSRVHVDDLAAVLEAAVDSELQGAWPLADTHACTTNEITRWCEELLGICGDRDTSDEATGGRVVDGSGLRRELGLEEIYPSYREGVVESLTEEALL